MICTAHPLAPNPQVCGNLRFTPCLLPTLPLGALPSLRRLCLLPQYYLSRHSKVLAPSGPGLGSHLPRCRRLHIPALARNSQRSQLELTEVSTMCGSLGRTEVATAQWGRGWQPFWPYSIKIWTGRAAGPQGTGPVRTGQGQPEEKREKARTSQGGAK